MKALIDRIVAADSNPASNVEQVSAMVQEFYLLFRQRLDTHVHFQSMSPSFYAFFYSKKFPFGQKNATISDLTDTDKDTIIGLAEKYVMICCYRCDMT